MISSHPNDLIIFWFPLSRPILQIRSDSGALELGLNIGIWGRGRDIIQPIRCLMSEFSEWICVGSLSCVWLFGISGTVAHQAVLSMRSSQQEYWSELSFCPLGGSSWPRDWTHISCVSCIGRQILYHWASWEAPMHWMNEYKKYDPWCCDDKKCAFKHSLFSSYRAPFPQPHLAIWIRCSNFPYYSWSPTYSGNMTGTLWNFSFHCKLTWMVCLVIMGRRIQVVGNPVSSTNIFFQCLCESP